MSAVLAASQSSGYAAGLTVTDQTPDYELDLGTEIRRAIAQSIMIRGNVFAVVQRVDGVSRPAAGR